MAETGAPAVLAAPAACGVAPEAAASPLSVLLVNAMGDAALALTEQRFHRFLRALFPDRAVSLHRTSPASIARGEMAAARIARQYGPASALLPTPPDLVVFSGAEPREALLRDEAFWPDLVGLFTQVSKARIPAIFSCLAAHAAAAHFAGVARRRSARKIFGVFAQEACTAAVARGAPAAFAVAHSRWNALDAGDLRRAGYVVLSEGGAGVDAFAPADGTPHLYLQGHPEYEASALEGEYRRDLRRYEAGQLASAPDAPAPDTAPAAACAAATGFCRAVLHGMMAATVVAAR